MDGKTTLLLLILRMMGQRAETPADLPRLNASRPYVQNLVARAHAAALVIDEAVKVDQAERMGAWRRGQPRPTPADRHLLAAVSMKESSSRVEAPVGDAGELGLFHVKPDGAALELCVGLDLERPVENARCGIRILRNAERRCGPEPVNYLGRYNGTRECGPTEYSRKVLEILDRAKRPRVALR